MLLLACLVFPLRAVFSSHPALHITSNYSTLLDKKNERNRFLKPTIAAIAKSSIRRARSICSGPRAMALIASSIASSALDAFFLESPSPFIVSKLATRDSAGTIQRLDILDIKVQKIHDSSQRELTVEDLEMRRMIIKIQNQDLQISFSFLEYVHSPKMTPEHDRSKQNKYLLPPYPLYALDRMKSYWSEVRMYWNRRLLSEYSDSLAGKSIGVDVVAKYIFDLYPYRKARIMHAAFDNDYYAHFMCTLRPSPELPHDIDIDLERNHFIYLCRLSKFSHLVLNLDPDNPALPSLPEICFDQTTVPGGIKHIINGFKNTELLAPIFSISTNELAKTIMNECEQKKTTSIIITKEQIPAETWERRVIESAIAGITFNYNPRTVYTSNIEFQKFPLIKALQLCSHMVQLYYKSRMEATESAKIKLLDAVIDSYKSLSREIATKTHIPSETHFGNAYRETLNELNK